MITIDSLTAKQAEAVLPELIALLQDAVEGGASISFVLPLNMEVAQNYWRKVLQDVSQGERILLVATDQARIVGSVQLALASQPNAPHRAEVQKLIVHRQARQQGIGQQLMTSVESVARQFNRTLLVLDTQRHSAAEHLYRKVGYVEAGIIPLYALSLDGVLRDTVFFYRQLSTSE